MKRIQLTDEEFRIIEQRRLMENRENLGYNEALHDLNTYIETVREGPTVAVQDLYRFTETQKKAIKP